MKEHYISNKIASIMGKRTINRMERERKIATITNDLVLECERSFDEFKRHMSGYIVKTLRAKV